MNKSIILILLIILSIQQADAYTISPPANLSEAGYTAVYPYNQDLIITLLFIITICEVTRLIILMKQWLSSSKRR